MIKKLEIKGMSCNHCVMHVTHALEDIDGVKNVKVSLKDNQAVVELSKEVSDSAFIEAVADAGYTVTKVE